MQDQVKYLEQKYSGSWNPMAQGQQHPFMPSKDHPVPIENYLNAQCTLCAAHSSYTSHRLI